MVFANLCGSAALRQAGDCRELETNSGFDSKILKIGCWPAAGNGRNAVLVENPTARMSGELQFAPPIVPIVIVTDRDVIVGPLRTTLLAVSE
jgi:hypothetical protein